MSQVVALTTELGEEKEEAARASAEVDKLTRLLRDKERLLLEASDLLGAAEAHCSATHAQATLSKLNSSFLFLFFVVILLLFSFSTSFFSFFLYFLSSWFNVETRLQSLRHHLSLIRSS